MNVVVDAQPSVLETAATLLRAFADRAPISDRQGLHGIADRFDDAVARAKREEIAVDLPHFDPDVSR